MSVANPEKSDALAKLRIKHADVAPRPRWGSRLAKLAVAATTLLVVSVSALALAQRSGLLSSEHAWLSVPDAIRSRTEVRVAAVTVQSGRSADATVVATGYLESRRQAKIGARAPGRIESVSVEEGTRVKDQQVLAVLEHADMDASLAAVRAMLEQSRAQLSEQEVEIARTNRDFERASKLRHRAGISEAQYDTAKFQYDAAVARRNSLVAAVTLAEARVRESEQLRENMFIRASFDGTVISKDAEVGESILPGGMGEASGRGSVVTIADLDHLEVECDVKEDFISRIQEGQAAEVAVDAVPDRRYAGSVRKIIPMGDRARATIKVKVEILDADDRLFPEMGANVYFLPDDSEQVSEKPRVFCPSSAVAGDSQNKFVFIVDDEDRARRVEISPGDERDGRTEVVAGLSGSERVVLEPPASLGPGDLVKVVE